MRRVRSPGRKDLTRTRPVPRHASIPAGTIHRKVLLHDREMTTSMTLGDAVCFWIPKIINGKAFGSKSDFHSNGPSLDKTGSSMLQFFSKPFAEAGRSVDPQRQTACAARNVLEGIGQPPVKLVPISRISIPVGRLQMNQRLALLTNLSLRSPCDVADDRSPVRDASYLG